MSNETTPATETAPAADDVFSLADAAAAMPDDAPAGAASPDAPQPTEAPAMTATAAPPKAKTPAANGKAKPAPKSQPSAAELADKATKGADKAKRVAAARGGKAGVIGAVVPPEKEQIVDLKQLVRDRRLQMRASLFDEATVESYRELYQDNPEALPPVRVMRIPPGEAEALKLPSNLVVWDGFQRTEGRQRAKIKSIPCLVSDGNWDLARLLSLKANHNAALPRNKADLKRAFHQLIENEALLAEVLAWGKGNGGPQRALALAVGVVPSTVSKMLTLLGKATDRNGIIDIEASKRRAASANGQHTRTGDPDPAIRQESKEAIKARNTAVLIKEMQNAAASYQRRVEAILERDDAANLFREVCKAAGYPIMMTTVAAGEGATTGQTRVQASEYLPPADAILLIADEMAEQHKKQTVDTTK